METKESMAHAFGLYTINDLRNLVIELIQTAPRRDVLKVIRILAESETRHLR